jgi:hypothetical protein
MHDCPLQPCEQENAPVEYPAGEVVDKFDYVTWVAETVAFFASQKTAATPIVANLTGSNTTNIVNNETWITQIRNIHSATSQVRYTAIATAGEQVDQNLAQAYLAEILAAYSDFETVVSLGLNSYNKFASERSGIIDSLGIIYRLNNIKMYAEQSNGTQMQLVVSQTRASSTRGDFGYYSITGLNTAAGVQNRFPLMTAAARTTFLNFIVYALDLIEYIATFPDNSTLGPTVHTTINTFLAASETTSLFALVRVTVPTLNTLSQSLVTY